MKERKWKSRTLYGVIQGLLFDSSIPYQEPETSQRALTLKKKQTVFLHVVLTKDYCPNLSAAGAACRAAAAGAANDRNRQAALNTKLITLGLTVASPLCQGDLKIATPWEPATSLYLI